MGSPYHEIIIELAANDDDDDFMFTGLQKLLLGFKKIGLLTVLIWIKREKERFAS